MFVNLVCDRVASGNLPLGSLRAASGNLAPGSLRAASGKRPGSLQEASLREAAGAAAGARAPDPGQLGPDLQAVPALHGASDAPARRKTRALGPIRSDGHVVHDVGAAS